MSVTIRDIANKLKISSSAVSLVLNNKPGISDETRKLVLDAAQMLGYEKHITYSQKSKPSLKYVIYKKHGNVIADTPFFAQLSEGISDYAQKKGYTIQIVYLFENQDLDLQFKALTESPSSGILLLATEMNYEDLLHFSFIKEPMVVLDSYFEDSTYDCVVINNDQGAYLATRHIMEMGHTNIGYLHSSVEINNFKERYVGFVRAISSNPETKDCINNIIHVRSTIDGAYQDMRNYIKAGNPIPKALFADNDIIAISCMRALIEEGYELPKDVSVVGFDNMPICEMFHPSLTTIHVPKQRLGKLAVERLINIIHGKTEEQVKISLSTSLIKRESVKRV